MKDEDGSEPQNYKVDGLEPPMFDDTWDNTWGLADDFDVMMRNGIVKSLFYFDINLLPSKHQLKPI